MKKALLISILLCLGYGVHAQRYPFFKKGAFNEERTSGQYKKIDSLYISALEGVNAGQYLQVSPEIAKANLLAEMNHYSETQQWSEGTIDWEAAKIIIFTEGWAEPALWAKGEVSVYWTSYNGKVTETFERAAYPNEYYLIVRGCPIYSYNCGNMLRNKPVDFIILDGLITEEDFVVAPLDGEEEDVVSETPVVPVAVKAPEKPKAPKSAPAPTKSKPEQKVEEPEAPAPPSVSDDSSTTSEEENSNPSFLSRAWSKTKNFFSFRNGSGDSDTVCVSDSSAKEECIDPPGTKGSASGVNYMLLVILFILLGFCIFLLFQVRELKKQIP